MRNQHLEYYILEYTQRNMLINKWKHQIMNMILQKLSFVCENPPISSNTLLSNTSDVLRPKMLKLVKEFKELGNAQLADEQSIIFETVLKDSIGMHIISGTPRSGKSFLIRYLSYHFISTNKTVLITASTGTAATRLSSIASTVHYQFKIPVGKYKYPSTIFETDERHFAIKEADAIIIDEFSMLTCNIFNMIVRQLVNVTGGTLLEPFKDKLVLLFGDIAQLPPICEHNTAFCKHCHITSSPYRSMGKVHDMKYSVRHAKDFSFLEFLQII